MAKTSAQLLPTIHQAKARAIVLHAAGLDRSAPFGKGRQAVYKFIHHIGFLQIDTQYVVERAHHHAIFNRVPDYQHEWLDELQEDGSLYEFWTHVAGYMPTEHYRFSIPVQNSFRERRKPLTPIEVSAMRMVVDRISREGPLRTTDFENDRAVKSSGWWDWRPSKVALERLYLEGKLLTRRDSNFTKYTI